MCDILYIAVICCETSRISRGATRLTDTNPGRAVHPKETQIVHHDGQMSVVPARGLGSLLAVSLSPHR